MKLKNFLISGLFLLLINTVNAQTTPVKIIDITVTPAIAIDSLTGNPLQTDSTDLIIQFKIKNVAQASKAYIYFGTAQDANDILSVQANFILESGKYYLHLNNVKTEVKGYAANMFIRLSEQQNDDYNYITLFVEDFNGLNSDKLYFEK